MEQEPTYGISIPADPKEQKKLIESLRKEMFDAAAKRDYERAAQLRDTIQTMLKQVMVGSPEGEDDEGKGNV